MTNLLRSGILAMATLMVALVFLPSTAAAAEGEELDPVGHSADGYYLDFSPFGKVELPRIFVVRHADGSLGLDLFPSSTAAVESGMYLASFDDATAVEDDDHAAGDEHAADEAGGDHEAAAGAVSPEGEGEHAEEGAHADYVYATLSPPAGASIVIDLSFTRHLIFAWLGMLIVALAFISMGRRYTRGVGRESAPKGRLQNMLETLVLFVRDDIARPNLGDKTDKYLPYLLTVFFFILTCNFLGLVPFGATATSNIMVTAVLATMTFLATQFGASKDHWMHVFWPPGVPTAVKPILIPVEILGLFTKPFALAIRLFANLTAGHLVILSLIGLIFTFANLFGSAAGIGVSFVSVAFALFIYCLEILVSFIQAYVFTMLSALFIGMAVAEHDHDHDDHHAELHELAGGHGEMIETTTRNAELVPAS